MESEKVYYIPTGLMRAWGEGTATIMPFNQNIKIDMAEHYKPSVGYIPVYESAQDLIAEHGVVPFVTVRRPV